MWQVDVPEDRKKLTLTLAASMHEELEAFVMFIQEDQPLAPMELIVEKIFIEFFSSRRQPIAAFRSWQEARASANDATKHPGDDPASCHDAGRSARGVEDGPSPAPKLRLPSPTIEAPSAS